MRKSVVFALVLVVTAVALAAALGAGKSAAAPRASSASPLSGKKIGIIYLTLADPFYQAFQKGAQAYAKANNISLVEIDGQANAQTMTSAIENMIVQKVDGIIFSPIDAAAAVTPIKEAQQANIPIVVNSIRAAGGVSYPFVGIQEGVAERALGKSAAKLFHKKFGAKTQARIMIEGCPTITIVSTLRSNGFLKGWRSVDPKPQVWQLDGKCTQAGSVTAMENGLQRHPNVNVLYGVNGIAVVGGLQALQAAGKAKTDKQLLAFATDGAEQEIQFAASHVKTTPLELAAAISPVRLAGLNFTTLAKVVSGQLSATQNSNTYIKADPLNYQSCTALQKWVTQDLQSSTKLKCTP